jgi:hypothetical protein
MNREIRGNKNSPKKKFVRDNHTAALSSVATAPLYGQFGWVRRRRGGSKLGKIKLDECTSLFCCCNRDALDVRGVIL